MKFSEFNVAVNTSQIDFIVGYKGLQNFRISPSDLVGTFSSLNYITDSGSGTIDLGTQAFSILGTANEIETSGALQTLTIGFPASGVTLPDGSVATTQTIGDNSTKIATTAYVDAAITAEDLDFSGDTGTGSVDLDSQILNIIGTTNEIETAASGQTLTIGLPDDVSITGELTVLGIGQSSFGGQVTIPLTPVATTDAASKGYVDSQVTAQDLDFTTDSGSGQVDLDSQIFNVLGTANEIETSGSGQTVTIGLPDDVTVTGELTVSGTGQSSFGGQVTIPATPVAGTDAASKDYVDSQVTAQDLDFTGDSGTGEVDLDSQALSITGGAVITTTALNQNLDIVHDNVSRADTTSSSSPAFGGTFTSVDSVSSSSQGHITAINVKTVTLPTPSDATITLDAGTLLNGGGDFTLNQALNETITFNHDSVSRTDTTSTDAPAFGGTFTAVDSVTSSTEGHITAINLKTVTVPTPTYPTVNNNTITIDAGSNLNGGGDFTLNQSFDETITVNLDTTITGLTSVTSTTFVGALQGNADTASALAASGNITLTGDTTSTGGPYTYTSGGNVAIATTIADTTVTGKVLTGVNLGTAQNIAATDTILEAFGYLQAQITQLPQGLVYNGTWNASTNTPTLTSGSGTTGHFYIVSVAGNTNLDGITDWQVGDWAIFVEAGGTDTWQKIDNTSAITGTGATNKLAKWTGPTTLSTGLVEDDGTTVTIGNSGDLDVTGSADITGDLAWGTSLTDTTNTISITKFVDEADGIVSNDNDTSIPTSAAVKDYVDTQLGGQDTLAEILANGNTSGANDIIMADDQSIHFGDDSDLSIEFNSVGNFGRLNQKTGHLYLQNSADNSDIHLRSDDGTGGVTTYFFLDGSEADGTYVYTNFPDNSILNFGNATNGDLQIYHDGTDSIIGNTNGDLYIRNDQDNGDIIFQSDNGSGGTVQYFTINGTVERNIFYKDTKHPDDVVAYFGNGDDLQIYHDAANSYIKDTGTGSLKIQATNLNLQNDAGESYIDCVSNAQVQIYYDNSKKFETTTNGVEVTGTLIDLDSSANATVAIDRAGTSNDAIVSWRNAGSEYFRAGLDSTNNDLWSLLHTCGNGLYFEGNSMSFGMGTDTPKGTLTLNTSGTFTTDSNDNDFSAVNLVLKTSNTATNAVGSGIVWLKGGSDQRKLAAITNYIYGDADQSGLNFYVQETSSGSSATLSEAMRITSDGQIYNSGSTAANGYNTFYGSQALFSRTSGVRNTAFGSLALDALTTGNYNTAIGWGNQSATTTGQYNTSVGYDTLTNVSTGTRNSVFGSQAGVAITTGSYNTILGFNAGSTQTDASYVTAVGDYALANNTGSYNTAVGQGASQFNSSGTNNTSVGQAALQYNTTGVFNTAIGSNAGDAITTGSRNTLMGYTAGGAITTANDNVVIGSAAGANLSTGNDNTIVGKDSGNAITNGQYNSVFGKEAGLRITGGNQNTLSGYLSGQALTTGNYVTAMGAGAGYGYTGTGATFLGFNAGYASSSQSYPTAIGYRALYQNSSGSGLVAMGYHALFGNTTGSENTAVGYVALQANSTGSFNTAVGMYAAYGNSTGFRNTVIGRAAGFNMSTGAYNTFVGMEAGYSSGGASYNTYLGYGAGTYSTGGDNTYVGYAAGDGTSGSSTGSQNTAIGTAAGYELTTGGSNTFIGRGAGHNNTTHDYGTFVGELAGYNNANHYNSFFGRVSGYNNTTGTRNTFIGYGSAYACTSGYDNTGIGTDVLASLTTGANNIGIGRLAVRYAAGGNGNIGIGYEALGGATLSGSGNNIALGHVAGYNMTSGSNNILIGLNAGRTGFQTPQSMGGVTTQSNQIHIGNESHTNALVQVSWTVNSDGRDKTDVKDLDLGLDFINSLRPVTYRWDKRSQYEDRKPTGEHKESKLEVGLIAQEVIEQENKAGYNFEDETNLFSWESEDKNKVGLQYEKLVPALINAIKELKQEIETLKSQINN